MSPLIRVCMKTTSSSVLLLLVAMLASCSFRKKPDDISYDDKLQGTLAIPSYSRNALDGWPQGRKVDPYDTSRVRIPEDVHTYYVGRLPSRDRREMHEAHTVYRVEQTAKWDQRLPATPMASRGVVLGIREPAHDPVPKDEVVANERARQMQLTGELQTRLAQMAEKQQKLEAYLASAPDKNKTIDELTKGKTKAEQSLATAEAEVKKLKLSIRALEEQRATEEALNQGTVPGATPAPAASKK